MAVLRRSGGSQGDWEGNSPGPLKPWVRCLREEGGKAGRGMGSCASHMSCPLQAPGLLPQDNGWGVSSLHQRLEEDAQATASPTLMTTLVSRLSLQTVRDFGSEMALNSSLHSQGAAWCQHREHHNDAWTTSEYTEGWSAGCL